MCHLASRAYFCPGPGSSEAILVMATWQSVKIVTRPSLWFLDVATCRQGSCEGRTLGVVCLLAPAHVGLVALPRLAVLPDDCVSGCSVLQPGSVCEDGESWPEGSLGLVCRYLGFLDGGGCIQWGGYLEEDRFLSAVPASQIGLESLAECTVCSSDELPGLVPVQTYVGGGVWVSFCAIDKISVRTGVV